MEDVKLVLEAPDSFIAAAVLMQNQFYMGKGDRTALFAVILSSDPTKIPELARKLKLVTHNSKMLGKQVYNDKLCSNLNVNQQTVYQLWLHCVRRH